ncbi:MULTISPECIES: circadian clock protein KaiC [Bradyrhizobium]|uniref:Circadian clock protein KaiC n=4 Tax=Bradyrhizobium TaxID=374 RepID=A0ABS5GJT0_9BRAD|nr:MULTISPECIES: circadian clock protein KaiC [Bradyrhizobium]MBR1141568.1 circadian clock protein KaiC [Bradyrhizobium denitrificans]MDU1497916.1 circadian clock protein KaiC [Bradyrhizobium sp.]MDU1548166.1 circadian clock protein KaiC [Bradyrhizobium sp.]MDU1690464.1 circadian clock protein KaiC [Bradyrhizobium sp.]MDU1808505.1 circadian clock protein KaiC [Bradyrhizobium sp.]
MKTSVRPRIVTRDLPVIAKSPTGIDGLDEVTFGGLPQGRPTLLCGAAGCGKTLFAMTFLYNGAVAFNEPGVFIAFEEQPEDLIKNVGSLSYDIERLIEQNKIVVDHIHLDRNEIEEAGDYDLDGLFIRIGFAIDSIGAKRVVIDTIETLFGGLDNQAVLRSELRRLFEWLKSKGVTAIITGERGDGTLTRYGLEEYVADCVILLDNRVHDQLSTRRLRVVKYRGTAHGTNEYPFIIDQEGITVMPITSSGLAHDAWTERVSTGIADLDDMLEGQGYYKGSSILVSGMAGSGKSTVSAHFANSICQAGQCCIYFALEESPQQIVRNMRSVGLDLQQWVDRGLLRFSARRPNLYGLETHLASMHREVKEFDPAAVVVDPISALMGAGVAGDVHSMTLRLIDFLKSRGVTALFTNLGAGSAETATTEMQISSLTDTWLLLYNRETNGEHNRQLYLLKSRGMAHSNQVREFLMSAGGISLREVYVGPDGVLTGSARLAQEAKDRADRLLRTQEVERRTREIVRRRREIAAQIETLQAQLASEEGEMELLNLEGSAREDQRAADRIALAQSRASRRAASSSSKLMTSGK